MNSHEQRPRVILNNDVMAARTATEKTLALTTMPRRKRMWGLRLYVKVLSCGEVVPTSYTAMPGDTVPDRWFTLSTGGLYRWTSMEAAEHFGKPSLVNTGDWRVERIPFWLGVWDSFMWLVMYSRRK
jgi:hypothetical protein